MKRIPQLIIDTDMSSDDLMAILYLLSRKECEVLAITVAGTGICHARQGAQNALRMLSLAGKETQGIPVAVGDEEPLDGFHSFPEPWRVAADDLYGVQLPSSPVQPDPLPAAELIIAQLTRAERPVTLLCLAPLTNVAQALAHEPAILAKIERLVIMAGAIDVKGCVIVPGFTDDLKNEVADWNSYVDPLAAQQVFRSGVPITLVPLDATNQVPLTREFVQLFTECAQSPAAKFLAGMYAHEMDLIVAGIYYAWDLVAATAIVDRDILRFQQRQLDVIVEYSPDGLAKNAQGFSLLRWDGQPRQAFDLYVSGQIADS